MLNYGRGIQKTRDEIGGNEDTNLLIKRFSEQLSVLEGPTKIEVGDVSNDTLWGLFNWNEANWDGEFTATTITQVLNPNDTFIDRFDMTTFIDGDNTTADTSVAGEVSFTSGEVLTSTIIAKDTRTYTSVTVSLTISSGTFLIEVQEDGTNWETVTNDTEHIITNTGTDIIYRITENGASTGIITNIEVEYK